MIPVHFSNRWLSERAFLRLRNADDGKLRKHMHLLRIPALHEALRSQSPANCGASAAILSLTWWSFWRMARPTLTERAHLQVFVDACRCDSTTLNHSCLQAAAGFLCDELNPHSAGLILSFALKKFVGSYFALICCRRL